MNSFLAPSQNYYGNNSVDIVGEKVKQFELSKVLIVTDDTLAEIEDGPVEKVLSSLKENNIEYEIFKGVEPNPKIHNCLEGLEAYNESNSDGIITVGGGSAHDTGKGIAIAEAHEGELKKYAGIELLEEDLVPIISVNTTAGTGSEVTKHCVLTDVDSKLKFVIVSYRNVPKVSVNDPLLMLSVPQSLTAATGMDALTHAIESFVSVNATGFTDSMAIQAVKLITDNLRQAVANGENIEARESMVTASVLAGMAFNNADLGYVHAMAHQLGGQYDMPHGVANSILLPVVMEYNMVSNPKKFAAIAEYLGENIEGLSTLEAADKSIESVKRLSREVGIPENLEVMDVKTEDFELMAENALEDGNAPSNPRKGGKEAIIDLFKKAYEQK